MSREAGNIIRVLIVDDIPETRENLKKLLFFETDIEVVDTATSGEEAVARARELRPDIILMDINMPGLDGISAGELITKDVPQAQIIMMSVQGEADYLRRSMLAGAREFLIKPFSSEELVSTIRRVYDLGATQRAAAVHAPAPTAHSASTPTAAAAARAKGGQVIAVYAPKGGVGCSTIAVNLAVAMREAKPDSKILLIDANLQFSGVDVLLNIQAQRTIVDLAEKVDDLDDEFVNSVISSHTSGIKVLLAPPRPELADLVNASQMQGTLTELRKFFDLIIIDTESALHDLELTILDMATRIVLITTAEIPSIKNAKLFFDVAHALEYPNEKILLVVNESDQRGGIRVVDIEQSIRHPVACAIPVEERVASTAVNQGVPLVLTHRNSIMAQRINDLARQLLADLAPADEHVTADVTTRSPSLLGKLFK
jgi:pilus assembly protein CpaE